MLQRLSKELRQGKTFLQFGFLKGLGQGLGMVAPLVVAKYFEPDLFGSYSLAKMIVFFFATLLISSLQLAFVIFANQEKAKSGKINKTFSAQCLFLLLSCVLFVTVLGIFNRQAAAFAKINSGDLWFVLLAFLGLSAKSFLCNLFMATDERIKNSLTELVFGFFSIAGVFFFHLTLGLNLRTVLSIYPIAAVFLLTFFVPTVKFQLLLPLKIDVKYLWQMFSFTKWQFLGLTAIYFINWGDNLVLRYYDSSMGDIGIYNLAYSIFKGIVTLASIVGFYFLPFVSQNINNSEKIRDYLSRKRPRILALGISGIIALALLGPPLLSAIYPEYKGAGPILMVLMLGAICNLYSTFYHPIYSAKKFINYVQLFHIIQVVLNVTLSFILIRYFGLMGAAIATVIAYAAKSVLYELYFRMRVLPLLKSV